MLLGSAFFHDIPKPAAILCKALQDEVCMVHAAEALIKALKIINTLKPTQFEDLPTIKKGDLKDNCRGFRECILPVCRCDEASPSSSISKVYFCWLHRISIVLSSRSC